MKKYFVVPAAMLLLAIALSGCFFPGDGYRDGGGYGGGGYGGGGYGHPPGPPPGPGPGPGPGFNHPGY